MPMKDFTPSDQKTSKMLEMKNRLARPSKDTLFFLQLFARVYEPQMALAV